MRRAAIVTVVLGLLMGVFAAQASAHKTSYAMSTTFSVLGDPGDPNLFNYSGTLSSEQPRCIAGVPVTVNSQGGANVVVQTTSDGAGFWSGSGNGTGQSVYVPVMTLKKNKKHKHVCEELIT